MRVIVKGMMTGVLYFRVLPVEYCGMLFYRETNEFCLKILLNMEHLTEHTDSMNLQFICHMNQQHQL